MVSAYAVLRIVFNVHTNPPEYAVRGLGIIRG